MSPEELWAQKYAPRFAEERAREEARREEAFLDLPHTVCGEPIRAMTAMDLLVLNGIDSPFVCYGAEPEPEDIAALLWWLHVENDHADRWRTRRAKNRMLRRIAGRDFDDAIKEVRAYVDAIFQDAPAGRRGSGDDRRPLGTCFLAPLLMSITAELGTPLDPVTGKPFAHSPLSRLFQYTKAIARRKLGNEFVDSSPSDRLTGEFLDELNAALDSQPSTLN